MTEAETKSIELNPEALDTMRRIIVTAQGGDPDAQQTLNAFLKFNNSIERTNLPKRRDVHTVSFLDLVGRSFFINGDDNPFSILADCIATAFMAKGGDKSKQFVELMKQTPSLSDLQLGQGPQERSLTDRILGRGKKE